MFSQFNRFKVFLCVSQCDIFKFFKATQGVYYKEKVNRSDPLPGEHHMMVSEPTTVLDWGTCKYQLGYAGRNLSSECLVGHAVCF